MHEERPFVRGRVHRVMPMMVSEVSSAKQELLGLCRKEVASLWSICHPKLDGAGDPFTRAPSSSGSSQTFWVKLLSDVNEELRDHLVALVGTIGQGLAKLFPMPTSQTCVLHNESFWNTFYLELVCLLGVSLKEAYGPGDEAELCADLLKPLLDKPANCVSMMFVDEKADVARPAGEDGDEGHDTAAVYHSTLTLQARTEARKGQRGMKPCCDFSFEGWSGERPLYFIPIEAKVLIKEKHMSQLAHYMTTTVLVKYGKPKANIGVLIDKDSLCLAFSVTSVQVGQETIPLPVVLFSPQLKWRKGLAVQKPVVIALCLLCLYQETELIQTPPVWKKRSVTMSGLSLLRLQKTFTR